METRREQLRGREVVERVEFEVGEAGPLVRFSWSVHYKGGVRIEAYDDLELKGANRVKRLTYKYHATIEGGPNIVRYGGPDTDKSAPHDAVYYDPSGNSHHTFHHVHRFHPLGDREEVIDVLDEEETPTLPEFVDRVADWCQNHRDEVTSL